MRASPALVTVFGARFALFVTALSLCFSAAAAPFNEMVGDDGRLRPAYREFERKLGRRIYPLPDQTVQTLMGAPLGDSIRILPIPLLLSTAEYGALQSGAMQRARALREFFADVMIHGGRRFKEAKLAKPDFIEYLAKAEHGMALSFLREYWKKRSLEDVRFFYGPDIVRDENGEFRVIEDNVGPIGGLGDSLASQGALQQAYGLKKSAKSAVQEQIEAFLSDIPKERWASDVIVILHSDSDQITTSSVSPDDQEDVRKASIIKGMGLPIVKYSEISGEDGKIEKLWQAKKVVNFVDPLNFGASLENRQRMLEKFAQGQIQFMFSPGCEILGNKSMLPLMEKIVRVYLNEEPILKSQPSEWVTDVKDLDPDRKNTVYKITTLNQGNGVFLMDELPEPNRKVVFNHLKDWIGHSRQNYGFSWPWVVRQEYLKSSYIPAALPDSWIRFNVDIRPLVHATGGPHQVLPTLWGRANLAYPGSKNNVSINAMELVIQRPVDCELALSAG